LPAIRLGKITDGLSKTAAFAEVVNGIGDTNAVPVTNKEPLADCGESAAPSGPTVQAIRDAFLTRDWNRAPVPWSGDWRWRGYPWTEGTMWRTWYNHLLPPNSHCWMVGDWWELVSPATSYHNGVINMVLCDGSVQSVAVDIDPEVWTDMGTRDGTAEVATP
jgi:prepilin-type processing-associated H-X9-DG protein